MTEQTMAISEFDVHAKCIIVSRERVCCDCPVHADSLIYWCFTDCIDLFVIWTLY